MAGRRLILAVLLSALAWPAAAQQAAAPVTAATFADITYGRPDAPITILEYASLSCSHCAHFHNDILPKLKARYIDNGQVRLVVKDIPNNGPGLRAAQLARCAGDEKHEKLADILFKTQTQWQGADFANGLIRIGAMAGVSPSQVQACMTDKRLEDFLVNRQQEAAQVWKVRGTPTFIINNGAARLEEANEAKLFDILDLMGAKAATP